MKEAESITEQINELNRLVAESSSIVFFGGAGVSTESGIPDFRSEDGLYSKNYDYPPEFILSHTCFSKKPDVFFKFYREKMINSWAQPNGAHLRLADMEKMGKLKAVITQNIDGLHQKAGSKNVLELHGSILNNYCVKCNKKYSLKEIINSSDIPYCDCGGIIKPDVVLYEESLSENTLKAAVKAVSEADMLIVAGTSLSVYPAAGLINYYKGKNLVMINSAETPLDSKATLLIHAKVGEILRRIRL